MTLSTNYQKDLSVIIPAYNEADNLAVLCQQIKDVLGSLEGNYEVLVVDDGSTDDTFGVIERLHQEDPTLRIIRLSRNFGQTAALAAGLAHARGEIIVTLDGDLQNDPADIPRLIAKLKEGYDLVNGWRLNRQDPFLTRRLPSTIANWLISLTTRVKLHDYGCTLKAFRSEVAKSLHLYGEMHRFIPALAGDLGAAIAEVPVNHRPRSHGNSKYGLSRTIRVILDLITVKFLSSYSTRPIHIFGSLGLLSTFAGSVLTGYLGIERLIFGVELANRPLLLLGILLMLVGVQFITMGLLGEMLVRIYHEGQEKPVYILREVLDSSVGSTLSNDCREDSFSRGLREEKGPRINVIQTLKDGPPSGKDRRSSGSTQRKNTRARGPQELPQQGNALTRRKVETSARPEKKS